MKAYSLDLRQRVLSAALRGDRTIPEVAELFGVSLTFVNKLLRAAVASNNDATLGELREHLARRARVEVSEATVSRVLTKLGLPCKKSLRAAERNNYKRGWFRRRARRLRQRRFIFIDESAVNTATTRRYGRAPRGERAYDSAPRNYGAHTSVFNAYAEQVLGPRLRKGAVVEHDHGAPCQPDRGGGRGAWRPGVMAAALLARLLSHRAVLVKDQGLPTWGEGPHARSIRGSADGRPRLSDEG